MTRRSKLLKSADDPSAWRSALMSDDPVASLSVDLVEELRDIAVPKEGLPPGEMEEFRAHLLFRYQIFMPDLIGKWEYRKRYSEPAADAGIFASKKKIFTGEIAAYRRYDIVSGDPALLSSLNLPSEKTGGRVSVMFSFKAEHGQIAAFASAAGQAEPKDVMVPLKEYATCISRHHRQAQALLSEWNKAAARAVDEALGARA